MSYDLMVFEPDNAPRNREAFMDWYKVQTRWSEDHGYNDPSVASPKLAKFYSSIIASFPPLNDPHIAGQDDDAEATDYSIGRAIIYMAFGWSQAERAHEITRALAATHRVGFFDVSGDNGLIVYPDENVES